MTAWVVVWAALSVLCAQDTPKASEGALTIEDIVRLAQGGMPDELIIARIKRNAKPFDLNLDEIATLRKLGVSEVVIKYLEDPSQPYSPPPPKPIGPPPLPTPLEVRKLPPEAGIYYLKGEEEFVPLDFKPVVPTKQPGKLLFLTTGHVVGSLIGAEAKTRARGPLTTFFFHLGEKASIDDLVLLSLETSSKQRNLDFGKKQGRPVFPVKSVQQFETKELTTGIYRLTVPLSKPGEYLFFILGSGDEKKGQLGKGYDFGVDKGVRTPTNSGVNK
jgi:hypothetical protein